MTLAIARVPTDSASKYLQQLCKHWSHKLEISFTPDHGTVRFPEALVILVAEDKALVVTIEAEADETIERTKDVVARHLDRFAFREAPLPFDWKEGL